MKLENNDPIPVQWPVVFLCKDCKHVLDRMVCKIIRSPASEWEKGSCRFKEEEKKQEER
jgi:hypothetical protein